VATTNLESNLQNQNDINNPVVANNGDIFFHTYEDKVVHYSKLSSTGTLSHINTSPAYSTWNFLQGKTSATSVWFNGYNGFGSATYNITLNYFKNSAVTPILNKNFDSSNYFLVNSFTDSHLRTGETTTNIKMQISDNKILYHNRYYFSTQEDKKSQSDFLTVKNATTKQNLLSFEIKDTNLTDIHESVLYDDGVIYTLKGSTIFAEQAYILSTDFSKQRELLVTNYAMRQQCREADAYTDSGIHANDNNYDSEVIPYQLHKNPLSTNKNFTFLIDCSYVTDDAVPNDVEVLLLHFDYEQKALTKITTIKADQENNIWVNALENGNFAYSLDEGDKHEMHFYNIQTDSDILLVTSDTTMSKPLVTSTYVVYESYNAITQKLYKKIFDGINIYNFNIQIPGESDLFSDYDNSEHYLTKSDGKIIYRIDLDAYIDRFKKIDSINFIRRDLDDVLVDNRHDTIWQDNPEVINTTTLRTYQEANSYCENLSLAGFTDWRLPNIQELTSITDNAQVTHIPNSFVYRTHGMYWSSTQKIDDTTTGWNFYSRDGLPTLLNRSIPSLTRCIRGTQLLDIQPDTTRLLQNLTPQYLIGTWDGVSTPESSLEFKGDLTMTHSPDGSLISLDLQYSIIDNQIYRIFNGKSELFAKIISLKNGVMTFLQAEPDINTLNYTPKTFSFNSAKSVNGYTISTFNVNLATIDTQDDKVSMLLGTNKVVHLAWVEEDLFNNTQSLLYSTFSLENPSIDNAKILYTTGADEQIKTPEMVLSVYNNAYLTFFLQREINSTNEGNFAVMYVNVNNLEDTPQQVSDNTGSTKFTVEREFNVGQNGLPNITFDPYQNLKIIYPSEANPTNDYKQQIIVATLNEEKSWDKKILVNLEERNATINFDTKLGITDYSDYNFLISGSALENSTSFLFRYIDGKYIFDAYSNFSTNLFKEKILSYNQTDDTYIYTIYNGYMNIKISSDNNAEYDSNILSIDEQKFNSRVAVTNDYITSRNIYLYPRESDDFILSYDINNQQLPTIEPILELSGDICGQQSLSSYDDYMVAITCEPNKAINVFIKYLGDVVEETE
jgi:hypothetical protein